MSAPELIETLARRLYENMERLSPGLSDFVPWDDLRDRDRRLYRLCIEDLLAYDVFRNSGSTGSG